MSSHAQANLTPAVNNVYYVEHIYDCEQHGKTVADHALSETSVLNPGEAVLQSLVFVQKAFTSGGSATVSFGYESSDPDNIIDDTAIASLTAKALLAGIEVDTASSALINTGTTPMQLSAGIKVAALTAGKAKIIEKRIKLY